MCSAAWLNCQGPMQVRLPSAGSCITKSKPTTCSCQILYDGKATRTLAAALEHFPGFPDAPEADMLLDSAKYAFGQLFWYKPHFYDASSSEGEVGVPMLVAA